MNEGDRLLLKWVILQGIDKINNGGVFTMRELSAMVKAEYLSMNARLTDRLVYEYIITPKGRDRLKQLQTAVCKNINTGDLK